MNTGAPLPQHSRIIRVVAVHDADDAPCVEGLKLQLVPALSNQLLSFWHGGEIQPGEDVEASTSRALRSAQILLLFISPRFNERYYERLLPFLTIGNNRQRRIVPVHARRCSWRDTPFVRLQYLPRDGEPLMRGSQLDEERVKHLADELLDLVEQVRTEPRDDLSITTWKPQVTASLIALMKEVIVLERQYDVRGNVASGSTSDAALSREIEVPDHRSLAALRAELEDLRAENRALAAHVDAIRKEQATAAVRLENNRKELDWLRKELERMTGPFASEHALDGRPAQQPAEDLTQATLLLRAQRLSMQCNEGAPCVAPLYRAPADTAFFHFLCGMVPGHQYDFIYRPEVPQGALGQTHFAHLARLIKYVEPRAAGSFAFAIGNLSIHDAYHEPGHGGMAILGVLPPYMHGIVAVDRQLSYGTLLEATSVLYRRLMCADGQLGDFYRAYVRAMQEEPHRVDALLAQRIAKFDDFPQPCKSTLGFDFIGGTESLPKQITIVHDDQEPFGMLLHSASQMASALYCSNIKWTSITSGHEIDISGGTMIRFVPRSETPADPRHTYLLDEVPEEPDQLLTLLFGAKRRVEEVRRART